MDCPQGPGRPPILKPRRSDSGEAMKDWKAIAKARGIDIGPDTAERTVAPLNEMEEIFRSLIPDLSPDIEPAFAVHPEDNE